MPGWYTGASMVVAITSMFFSLSVRLCHTLVLYQYYASWDRKIFPVDSPINLTVTG